MWFESRREQEILSLSKTSNWLWGNSSLVFSGHWCFLQGLERSGREVDHSRSSSAEVKNGRGCTSVPPLCLHGVDRELFYLLSPKLTLKNLHSASRLDSCFWTDPIKRAITSLCSSNRFFIERYEINSLAHRRSPSSIPGQSM
jgi:hypothetical protein